MGVKVGVAPCWNKLAVCKNIKNLLAVYFTGSETLPSTCYILSRETSIPFYSTSNGYKNDWYKQSGKNPKIWHLSEPFQEADGVMRLGRKNICINVDSPKDLVDKHLYTYLFFC